MIILCTSGDHVRQFMLTAYDMGFINGEFVFMDVELFIFKVYPYNYHGDQFDFINCFSTVHLHALERFFV